MPSDARIGPCQMVGEPQGKGNDRNGRIGPSGGGKDGASRDVEVGGAMNAAIAVYHPVARVRGHARGSHVMVAADRVVGDQRIDLPFDAGFREPASRCCRGDAKASKLLIEKRYQPGDGRAVDRREAPVEQ